jgi:stage V sporulation protein G
LEITEVRIFLKDSPDKKLKAYATVTFENAFVVRNIKVIEGTGGTFIAMPSRKLKSACPKCGYRNEIKSKYCNQCAAQIPAVVRPSTTEQEGEGAQSDHRDIAHPITQTFRDYLQKKVLEAYEADKVRGPSAAHNSHHED